MVTRSRTLLPMAILGSICLVFLVGPAVASAGQSNQSKLASPPTPPPNPADVHPIPSSQVLPATPGPYITRSEAEALAVQAGVTGAPETIVSAVLLPNGSVPQALGFGTPYLGAALDREMWLVKVHGAYVPEFLPPTFNGRAPQGDHYWVLVDGTNGTIISTGTGPANMSW